MKNNNEIINNINYSTNKQILDIINALLPRTEDIFCSAFNDPLILPR